MRRLRAGTLTGMNKLEKIGATGSAACVLLAVAGIAAESGPLIWMGVVGALVFLIVFAAGRMQRRK